MTFFSYFYNIHYFGTHIDLSQNALGQLFDFGKKITTHTGLSNEGLVAALDPGGLFRVMISIAFATGDQLAQISCLFLAFS